MQKIIITTSAFSGYSTIFKVDGDTIDLQWDDEMSEDQYQELCLATLPYDIRFEIFERMILSMIKVGLIRKALKCLLTSSSHICRVFYSKYIGNYNLNRSEVLDHLIYLFKFIDDITAEMFAPDSNSFDVLSLAVHCANPRTIDLDSKEWPLGHVMFNPLDVPTILQTHDNVKKVRTGPSYCDLVWVAGNERDGVVEASLVKGPVLILEVYHGHGNLVQRPLYIRCTNFFRNVIRMLKLCLGPRSGVYLVVPVEGFFGLLTEVGQ